LTSDPFPSHVCFYSDRLIWSDWERSGKWRRQHLPPPREGASPSPTLGWWTMKTSGGV